MCTECFQTRRSSIVAVPGVQWPRYIFSFVGLMGWRCATPPLQVHRASGPIVVSCTRTFWVGTHTKDTILYFSCRGLAMTSRPIQFGACTDKVTRQPRPSLPSSAAASIIKQNHVLFRGACVDHTVHCNYMPIKSCNPPQERILFSVST